MADTQKSEVYVTLSNHLRGDADFITSDDLSSDNWIESVTTNQRKAADEIERLQEIERAARDYMEVQYTTHFERLNTALEQK